MMPTTVASGWPWMQGRPVSIVVTPIPPANEGDDRPSVLDLIAEHRTLIDQVTTELSKHPFYEANKHDDLWILRFLLSHKGKVKPSLKAATHTLEFRSEHKLDDKDIRYSPVGPDVPCEAFRRYLKFCRDDTFTIVVPDPKLGVVGFLGLSGIDQLNIVKHVEEADWLPSFIYVAEWSHQWADFLTRTTGRLTASVRCVDVGGLALSKISMECNKRDGKAMKVTEDAYPQMLKCLFVCNSPVWIQGIWRLVRPLFPKRLLEKVDFVSPGKNPKERDRLLKYVALEHLPTRFGGLNETWPLKIPLPSNLD